MESVFITSYILFLIIVPTTQWVDIAWIAGTAAIAMVSKYILVFRKQHIFNPAAIALVIMNAFGSSLAFWWVGTPALFPVVCIVGFLMVRKVHRFAPVGAFLLVSLVSLMITGLVAGQDPWVWFKQLLLSWPLVFFAAIMFTEPLTMPGRRHLQIVYGAVIGLLFSLRFHIGPFSSAPELALVVGNIFSALSSPKQRLVMKFKEKIALAPNMFNFVFTSSRKLSFLPGQYAEWTLFHERPDTRGNRRYFTIASAPTEDEVAIGVRLSEPSSSFKKRLAELVPGDTILTSAAAGDFVLPKDPQKRLVFIAGGIGVTPFRSMLQYLIDTKEKRPITVLYSVRTLSDIAYKDVFDRAERELGIVVKYIVTDASTVPAGWTTPTGYISEAMFREVVDRCTECLYYISGPFVMVEATEKVLRTIGLPRRQIKTDFFPGFAG